MENARLLDRSSGQRKASIGTLYLSATHTIFVENNPETRKETWVRWRQGAKPIMSTAFTLDLVPTKDRYISLLIRVIMHRHTTACLGSHFVDKVVTCTIQCMNIAHMFTL